jgi:uncharacterized membrane protein
MSRPVEALTLTAAIGCGLIGGVFFAFSTFVMDGLRRLPPPRGAAAMQAINRAAPTPPFMAALFGTAALCLAVVVWAVTSLGEAWAPWALGAGILYVVGAIVLTMARNVPLNDALDAVDPDGPDVPRTWARYAREWTAWNHARTVASLAAAAGLIIALRVD